MVQSNLIPLLSIEDDPRDSQLLLSSLERQTFEVTTATDLTGGLELLKQRYFAAVILDLCLPDSNGLETLVRLRRLHCHVPVVLTVGDEDPQLATEAARLGAQACLLKKHITGPLLTSTLSHAIERSRLEQEVLRSHDELVGVVQNSSDAQLVLDSKGTIRFANESAARLFQRPSEELVGLPFGVPVAPAGATDVDVATPGEGVAELRAAGITWAGNPAYLTTLRDTTQPRRLAEQHDLLSRALEAAATAVVITDPNGTINWINRAFTRLSGYPADQVLGRTPAILKSGQHDPGFYRAMWETITSGRVWSGEVVNRNRSGSLYTEYQTITPVLDDEGVVRHFIGIKHDVTERRQTERALRRSEEKYRRLIENLSERHFFYHRDADGRVTTLSPSVADVLGYEPDEFIERFQEPIESLRESARPLHSGPQGPHTNEVELEGRDGSLHRLEITEIRVTDEDGNEHVEGVALDVTEERRLEEQLRQSQKLEAVGRLAGGLAHDFNNMLSAIMGFSELALTHLEQDHPIRSYIERVHHAGEQSAALTHQLLAFSRRMVLQPRPADLNEIIRQALSLLTRLIGANIEVKFLPKEPLGAVAVDPTQMEQVVVNLALNARDAMPQGGLLTIETQTVVLDAKYTATHPDLRPGPHVLLAVSDTGVGMDSETLAHIFEPFYTTKPEGRGTGLGLASIHGFVKQSGGSIWVYSEPEQGTTFKIYLPRVQTPSQKLRKRPRTPTEALRGTETIFVLEDDDLVRDLIETTLKTGGFQVITAAEPGEALRLCQQHGDDLDLILSDVIVGRQSGPEVVREVLKGHPHIKVLFMSGYTEGAAHGAELLAPNAAFLPKPITPHKLLESVRWRLDQP